ncbi:MAG: hypothetical protein GY870_06800, partial [archaeon]|nr:hypothetical protein [archaeon]
NKISILNSLHINIEINDRTFLDTISYSDANYARLLDFINSEWNELFSNNNDSKPEYEHDLLETMWG